ncbi:MAG: ADP-ribosylation factor-like protein [Proteobacteria bacterium]|nr:ADP-ribosylation factor-like protein [Pseudomonadota bacterium]
MANAEKDGGVVEARIVYWGIEGSGKSTNLGTIHAKLRAESRGELRRVPTRLDPTAHYEVLPIELGEVKGVKTRLQVIAVPGAPEHAPTRKQLLDQVDGVVLVVDARRECIDQNVESFDELRQSLAAYGRSIEAVPVVVQYNKRDLADPYALEELYRKLDVPGAAVFEAVATEGGGVLRTLTTISKRVVRLLREQGPQWEKPAPQPVSESAVAQEPAAAPVPDLDLDPRETQIDLGDPSEPRRTRREAETTVPETPAPISATQLMEEGILADGAGDAESAAAGDAIRDAQTLLDRSWDELSAEAKPEAGLRLGPDLRIVSVGSATVVGDREVRFPVVLGNDQGESVTLALTVRLDLLLDDDG